MEKFKFSLDNIIKFKIDREEEIILQFADVQNILIKEQKILKDLEDRLDEALISARDNKELTTGQRKNVYQYSELLRQRISLQRENVLNIKDQVEIKRKELVEAQKERKAMEKLKERAYEKYKGELKIKEQKESDEIALFSFIRR